MKNLPKYIKKILSFSTSWLPARVMRRLSPRKRRIINVSAILILLFLTPVAIYGLLHPGGIEAAWWNDNWLYRTSINITAHSAQEKNVYINIEGGGGAVVQEDLTEGVVASSTTPFNITAPATVNSGDLLLLMLSTDGNVTITHHTDWTKINGTAQGGVTGSWYYIIADGTEGGQAYEFSTSASETHAWHIRRFSNWHGTTPPEVGTAVTSAGTSTPDPPSLTASWGAEDENMFVAVEHNDSDEVATAYPTGYTSTSTINSAGAGGNTGIASGIKSSSSATDDPTAFTLDGSEETVAQTIVIRPASGGGGVAINTSDTAKFQSDCGDLRFTDQGGNLLKYYIVSGCGTTNTVIHVFFETFPAGAQTLYYYYGNPNAANGFETSDFTTEASSYTIGSLGSEEKGPSPLVYFPFDEGTGNVATSAGVLRKEAGLYNGPTWGTVDQCVAVRCVFFEGTDDFLKVESPSLPTGDFSYSVWINFVGSNEVILAASDGSGGDELRIRKDSSDTIEIFLNDENRMNTARTITASTWHHIVVTRSGSTINTYIDGIVDPNTGTDATAVSFGSCPLLIGADNSTSGCTDSIGNYFEGYIDELKIYNYALSEAQVKSNFNARGGNFSGAVLGTYDGALGVDPVGYWLFNEGYGVTSYNGGTQGQALNATLSGAYWTEDGKFAKAIVTDGVASYASIPDDSAIDFAAGDDFTVSFWVLDGDGNANQDGIVEKWAGSGGYPYLFRYTTDGSVRFARYDGTNNPVITGSALISDKKWHHVLGTKNGSTLSLYIDGNLQNTTTDSTTGTTTNASDVEIGRRGSDTNFYAGTIDELKIYNYGVSASDVQVDYNQGKSVVLGSFGMDSSGVASNSANAVYCVPGSTIQTCQPVGEWLFEEGQGTAANDTTGQGNNAQLVGTPNPTWVAGKIGKALQLDNAGSAGVQAPDSASLSPTSAVSMTTWFKLDRANGVTSSIIEKRLSYVITLDGNGQPTFSVWTSSQQNAAFSRNLTPGQWYHLAATYDGAEMVAYINGVEVNSTADTGAIDDTSQTLRIGINGGTGHSVDGTIDQVRIYNYALSPAQVAWDYNRGKPTRYYKFDECQGSSVNDSSGNGKTGTITIGGSGTTSVGTCETSSTAWGNGVSGKFNYSLDLDGTDDYVSVATPQLPTNDFTTSSWVKLGTATDETILMASNGTGGDELRVHVNASGQVEVYTAGLLRATSTQTISIGSWAHVAVASSSGTQKIYINGRQDPTTGSGVTRMAFSTCSLLIGVDADSSCTGTLANYLDGQVDEMQIFNYPLTDIQIKLLYNQSSSVRFGPVTGAP